MSNKKRPILLILILLILLFAIITGVIIFITNNNSKNNLNNNTILQNCDSSTNICTVSSGVCNPAKAFIHICNDLKSANEKCISSNPIQVEAGPFSSGNTINLNDYTKNINCGTVQMYLELNSSNVNSVGACGNTVKKFASSCNAISYPSEGPIYSNKTIFNLTSTFIPSCSAMGDALLKYTVSITNNSINSKNISTLTVEFNNDFKGKNLEPSAISNNGKYSNGLLTWELSELEKTFNANQQKSFTYNILVPKNRLQEFGSGIKSSSILVYESADLAKNIITFEQNSKHNCTIETQNTASGNQTSTQGESKTTLPTTAIEDDIKLFITGVWFILLASIFYKLKIGLFIIKIFLKDNKN